MTNDTTTLNGSLRQLGETMAANLTTQGVPSTYDEGLTTLAGKILDIQGGGGVRTLTLTADKSILSYYDGDTATLSATLLEDGEPVSGETVEFFNGSTSLGTAQTDSNGVAVKTYASTGVGDIQVYAKVRTLVTEIYAIEDCAKYYGQTFSSTVNANLSLPNNCSIEFILNSNSSTSNNAVYLKFDNASKFVGKTGSSSRAIMVYDGSNHELNTLPVSTDTTYIVEWINNVCTFKSGTDSITFNMTNPTLLELINATSNGKLKNLKIKPL